MVAKKRDGKLDVYERKTMGSDNGLDLFLALFVSCPRMDVLLVNLFPIPYSLFPLSIFSL
jgi:hypothetical protein